MKNNKKNDVPEIPIEMKYFYTVSCLMSGILDKVESKFKKEFDDLDLMNVATFLLHGIVCTESKDEKEIIKQRICEMIDNPMHLNEFLYTRAKSIKAYDNTFYDCLVTGNLEDLDNKLNDAVEKAEYKAWNDEQKIINASASFKNRYNQMLQS